MDPHASKRVEPLQASRYLKMIVLLSPLSLREWVLAMQCSLCNISRIVTDEEALDFREGFFTAYERYFEVIREGSNEIRSIRSDLVVGMSIDDRVWGRQSVGGGRELIRPIAPLIQTRPYQCVVGDKGEIKDQILGKGATLFGLEVNYPQLYRDRESKQILNGLKDAPNRVLWKEASRWLRHHTELLKIKWGDEIIATHLRIDRTLDAKTIKGLQPLCPVLS